MHSDNTIGRLIGGHTDFFDFRSMKARYVSSVLKTATGELIFHLDKLQGKQVGDKFCLTAKLGSSKNLDGCIIIEKSVSIMCKKIVLFLNTYGQLETVRANST